MAKISASILSADFSNLNAELNRVKSADFIHLDVMDGSFVPNISFGAFVIKALRPLTSQIFDVHLMTLHPETHIKNFANAGADYITFHYEASDNPINVINLIRSLNCKAGIAINPSTPTDSITHLLPDLDLVLVMSVNPGLPAQSFIPSAIDKVNLLHNLPHRPLISVDGGINPDTAQLLPHADVLVAGSAIFNSTSPSDTIRLLK